MNFSIPNWAELAAVSGFLALLMGILPMARVRQATLAAAQAGLQLMLLGMLVAGLVFIAAPATEPAWVTRAVEPWIEFVCDKSGLPAAEARPPVLLVIAAGLSLAGLAAIQMLAFARRLGLLTGVATKSRAGVRGGGGPSCGPEATRAGSDLDMSWQTIASLAGRQGGGRKRRLADLLPK